MPATYEVLAVKYAELARTVEENFADGMGGGAPMPMDYFFWVVRDDDRTVVVDTGFGAAQAEWRGRKLLVDVGAGLADVGVDPDDVTDVVLTHLHYDHAGRLDLFPTSRLHVNAAELRFVVSQHMADPHVADAYVVDDIAHVVSALHEGRVHLSEEVGTVAPGITTRRLGGHTGGLQVVEVDGHGGPLALISDAAHFYANLLQDRPFPVVHDVPELRDGYRRLRALASSGVEVVPGHDPEVLTRFPAYDGRHGRVALLSSHVPTAPQELA